MGIFGSQHRPELARVLLSVANAYLNDLDGSKGMFDAVAASSRARIDKLADAVRADEGAKGLRKAKKEAMTLVWKRLTANPNTSFKEGSPTRGAYDKFEAFVDGIVPD